MLLGVSCHRLFKIFHFQSKYETLDRSNSIIRSTNAMSTSFATVDGLKQSDAISNCSTLQSKEQLGGSILILSASIDYILDYTC